MKIQDTPILELASQLHQIANGSFDTSQERANDIVCYLVSRLKNWKHHPTETIRFDSLAKGVITYAIYEWLCAAEALSDPCYFEVCRHEDHLTCIPQVLENLSPTTPLSHTLPCNKKNLSPSCTRNPLSHPQARLY